MSEQELLERSRRAKAAWDEFGQPFIEAVRAEYLAELARAAAQVRDDRDIKAVVCLSIATRVIDKVEEQFKQAVATGDTIARKAARAEQIAQIPARKRRFSDMLGA
jgi:hypothetical protein